jgi:hypothetical protein
MIMDIHKYIAIRIRTMRGTMRPPISERAPITMPPGERHAPRTVEDGLPIFHRCDETIRGHVFCSFLALILRKDLQARLEARGEPLEWDDIVRDLDALTETEVVHEGKRFRLRAEAQGTCGKVFQAVGVSLPPTVRRLEDTAQA